MNRTSIEWVRNPDGSQGWTFNPLTGCLYHVNGMCQGGNFPCYAHRLATTRLKERYLANKNIAMSNNPEPEENWYYDPFYPRFWPERLDVVDQLKNRRYPVGIFVCDMSDLFGRGIPEAWTEQVFDVIKRCPQHRFYLLTKQPQNLPKFSPFPDNCWVGVTATNRIMLNKAIGSLAQVKARVKYISFEPLLDSVDRNIAGASYLSMLLMEGHLNWVIIGAQTKPTVMPQIAWVQEIVEAADKAGAKVFLKNNLEPLLRKPFAADTDTDIIQPFYRKQPDGCWRLRQEMPN